MDDLNALAAARINTVAQKLANGRGAAWISELAANLGSTPKRLAGTLTRLQTLGLVQLGRCDLVGAFDPEIVSSSEIPNPAFAASPVHTFHYVMVTGRSCAMRATVGTKRLK